MKYRSLAAALAASAVLPLSAAHATDLEVTHWWTSGGEAAAVAEFAKAFDATGNNWVDGAIAGSGDTARPIMVSRITGGDPMAATQFNHGRQAEELVEAGLMRDLDDVATAENWKAVVNPPSLLESCTLDGKIYCVPVNIHSWQWLWLSNKAFEEAGVPVPTNWNEFVAAAPALEKAGIQPLAAGAQGWQLHGIFYDLMLALGGEDLYLKVYEEKDADVAGRPGRRQDLRGARRRAQDGAGKQRPELERGHQHGHHRQGRRPDHGRLGAGRVPGGEPGRRQGLHLPGRSRNARSLHHHRRRRLLLPADRRRGEVRGAGELASVMLSPETQVAFNLKKGSLPVRGDIDLSAANDCMKKGLEVLKSGNVLPSTNELITEDTNTQLNDLMTEFFSNPSMTPEDAQARFAEIIASAD